ncbi:MAG: hypothetical protein J6M95_03065 [Bacilli bacterium]|nr:hypothetical protein [Bacilli bacterium]
MKTKQELLEKYKSNKEFYELIDAHYGTKASFQIPEVGIIFFDRELAKGIIGGEKLSYEDFIDIQIQTKLDFRSSFFMCWVYTPMGFKGEVETFAKSKICFKRIYDEYMLPDTTIEMGKEDHVWMSSEGFGKLNKGDCVSFSAEVYRYIKKSDGKRLDYGLRNPEGIKKINKYDLPSEDDLIMQTIDGILCETCEMAGFCATRSNCMRDSKERKLLKKQMFEMVQGTFKKEK